MFAWEDAAHRGAEGVPADIRVFILDDHELVRRGLQELLEGEGFLVVGSSGSAIIGRPMVMKSARPCCSTASPSSGVRATASCFRLKCRGPRGYQLC